MQESQSPTCLRWGILLALAHLLTTAAPGQDRDIWVERGITLSDSTVLSETRIGIWDTGVDTSVYRNRVFTNPRERLDGQDNDGNGFVDDLHGIAFDTDHRPSSDLLASLEESSVRRGELEDRIKGFSDLTASVASADAYRIRQELATLQPEEIQLYLGDLRRFWRACRGTAVAGVVTRGNPAARIVVARVGDDLPNGASPPDRAIAERFCDEVSKTVAFFRSSGVRVANIGWCLAKDAIRDRLEIEGIGNSDQEREALARDIFLLVRTGLESALARAPEILFICTAGCGHDKELIETIPSSIDLPNLIRVGAVDRSGATLRASSLRPSAAVYANGREVETFLPGGRSIRVSGSWVATAGVTNLAGKLLALDSTLSPTDVVDLVLSGSEPRGIKSPIRLLSPKRSVELLRGESHRE